MSLSAFEIFKVGIGPSSSHTVGPMRAAARFARLALAEAPQVARVCVELYGSLALTGKGHGTDVAIVLGLEGEDPETVPIDAVQPRFASVLAAGRVHLGGARDVAFPSPGGLIFHRRSVLPLHSNGMRFSAYDEAGSLLLTREFYSVGGGFVVDPSDPAGSDPAVPLKGRGSPSLSTPPRPVPNPFRSGAELLALCHERGVSISTLVLENECALRPEVEVRAGLLRIWETMQACVRRGCEREGILPGGLRVKRRAASLHRRLRADTGGDPLAALDWVSLWALAVNEENAAGGRVVTAPTNGAAGLLPAVLHHYVRTCRGADDDGVVRFLLTASAIGTLFKLNASISGAEVGCQGEVGVACSMAAAGLAEVLGGTPEQVENAAEIGMEHNLGLTCDPIGGLVQVPCIERNAMGAVKAINGARLALQGDGRHHVSLDKVIAVMRRTGADMSSKYKETSRGGLAVNLIEC